MDNWDDFRFLLAVMEEGSLNAASRRLGVNHATVLRRVNAFETRTGVRIFDRGAGGYRMLASQFTAREALARMAEAAKDAERAMLGHAAGVAGPLRVTSTDSLCSTILPRVVAGLQTRHPDLQIELLVSNAHVDLSRLDAEVTVRPAPELPAELSGDLVARMVFGAYATPGYLARRQADGGGHRWLSGSGPLQRSPAVRWVESNVPANHIVQRADSFVTLRNLARLDLGIALLPRILVGDTDCLLPLPDAAPVLSTNLWVAHHEDLLGVARISACRVYLAEALAALAPALAGEPSPE